MPETSGNKIEGLESKVALNAKAITHLAILVKKHRLNCLCLTAKKGEVDEENE